MNTYTLNHRGLLFEDIPLDSLTVQLQRQGLTVLLPHEEKSNSLHGVVDEGFAYKNMEKSVDEHNRIYTDNIFFIDEVKELVSKINTEITVGRFVEILNEKTNQLKSLPIVDDGWVKVESNQFPENKSLVLFRLDNGIILSGIYYELDEFYNKNVFNDYQSSYPIDIVTHYSLLSNHYKPIK